MALAVIETLFPQHALRFGLNQLTFEACVDLSYLGDFFSMRCGLRAAHVTLRRDEISDAYEVVPVALDEAQRNARVLVVSSQRSGATTAQACGFGKRQLGVVVVLGCHYCVLSQPHPGRLQPNVGAVVRGGARCSVLHEDVFAARGPEHYMRSVLITMREKRGAGHRAFVHNVFGDRSKSVG